ncbi:MAG: type I glyceraldehyde-3-phosphate dehydrogenase [Candidatus Helarchaeota archaeon]
MTVKIGINGFGRIGKLVFRAILKQKADVEVVGINDLTDTKTLATLLKYDSTFGILPNKVEYDEKSLIIDGKAIPISAIRNPEELPWSSLGAKIVVESTGIFRKREAAAKHLSAGAEKVIISAPSPDPDYTVVMGVNDSGLTSDHKIVSNASCTTNSLAPPTKVINDTFGIEKGVMTTVHSYTNDQRILDFIHKDLRRARAAAANIIPTSTGAAKAVGLVIPELNGKLNGISLRVPTPDGSVTDLTAVLKKDVTKEEINNAIKEACNGPFKGIMQYNEDPIVLKDIIGNSHSAIFDAPMTMVVAGNCVKILSWYDNEWGFSNRMVDLIQKLNTL